MPVIPESERIPALSRLGLTERLIEIASGRNIPDALFFTCEPIYKVYVDGEEGLTRYGPSDFLTIPLWESDSMITAVKQESEGILFFEYSLEDDEFEIFPLSRTEQGL